MSHRRKLLFVSWQLKPARGGSVEIAEKLLRNFAADEVAVIGELGLLKRMPTHTSGQPRVRYFRSGFSLFGRGARFFGWFRWLLLGALVRRIVRIAREEQVDCILAVFPDEFFCYAACLAARRLSLPFSTYFHNTYLDNEAVDQRRGEIIQPALFGDSECIFVMSEGMKRFYVQKYGLSNVVPLVHTFDKYPSLPAPTINDLREQETVRVVLFGNFNHSNSEATARFVNAVSSLPQYDVSFYTHVPIPLLRLRGIDTDRINHRGYIDDSQLIDELQQYDIVVLTHGFTGAYGSVEYRTIFPTRTIPMLLCQKPLLVHSPREAFLTDFVREHDCGIVVDEPRDADVVKGLTEIVENPERAAELVRNAKKTVAMFYGPAVSMVLRRTLRLQPSAIARPSE